MSNYEHLLLFSLGLLALLWALAVAGGVFYIVRAAWRALRRLKRPTKGLLIPGPHHRRK